MKHTKQVPRDRCKSACIAAAGLVGLLLSGTAAQAASATFDFTADPTAAGSGFIIGGNNDAPWVASGGNTGGFLALTYPIGSQYTGVVFPDIDNGKVVTAFKFECDLRVGNSTGDRAADGFSISFARGNDPVLAGLPESIGNQGNFAGGIAEGGTTTGIAIDFDTWSGNVLPDGGDIEGIIVRVDNKTILRQALPTRHGACDDTTSLQTGPRDIAYWPDGDPKAPESWKTLCWQPFSVELDNTGKLTVKLKGRTLLDKAQTAYFPSVGRLVLAGRTGGANEHTHIDNIKLTTEAISDSTPPTLPTALAGSAVHPRRVKLTWTAATDDSGRAAYEIERNGEVLAGLVNATTFAETVKPGSTTKYRIRAIDPALNRSGFTAEVSVTTPAEVLTFTQGVLKWEAYNGIGGTGIDALTGDAKYPDSADEVRVIGSAEGPTGYGDNYGARISGFVTPTETADYVFFLSADDNAQLFLSTDDKPANAKLIATEPQWNGERQWVLLDRRDLDFPENRSDKFANSEWPTGNKITLTSGRKYYISLIYKEGGGGDNGAIYMKKASDPDPANGAPALSGNILGADIDPNQGKPSILTHPIGAKVNLGASVTFSTKAIGTKPISYQWQRNGVNIAGATSDTYTVGSAGQSSFGSYNVVVSNDEGSSTSSTANLIVNGLPTVLYLHATAGPNDSDRAIVNRLGSQGWQVVTIGASPSVTGDADGKSLIMISSTVTSAEVGDKFKDSAVPVMFWEPANEDNFDTTDRANDADNVTRGNSGGQTQINIVKADHPLAAGLKAGLVSNVNAATDISWGVPGPAATIIATIADDPTRAAIYVYEKGAALFDASLKAPARRLYFGMLDNTFVNLNADGIKLFDAAVLYAAGGPPTLPSSTEYGIGLNFGAEEPNGGNKGTLDPSESAGVASVAQANWNNLKGATGTAASGIVADAKGAAQPTTVSVTWSSGNTWASTGRGEENNKFTGSNLKLTTGYLDTGNATTTTVSIASLPAKLTDGGYDVYVYSLGGVGGRGGAYRVMDTASGKALTGWVRVQSPTNSTDFVEATLIGGADPNGAARHAVGNYVVFKGLTSANITVLARTAGFGFSGTPRAPINAIQLVTPGGLGDVTLPGDAILSSHAANKSPGGEQVPLSIDNDFGTKYLNFGGDNSTGAPFDPPVGLTVTPSAGPSIVSGLRLTSANDAPDRDPAAYKLEGSNDGTTFTLISEGDVPLFAGRFTQQTIMFQNTVKYSSYRLTIPKVKNNTAANSMQVAEVELLGKVFPLPRLGVTKAADKVTVTFTGGNLEQSTSVDGPYTPVPNAKSPYETTANGPARFFRSKQ